MLLGADQLIVKQILVGTDEIRLDVESTVNQATCPVCREESSAVHSTYTRFPTDLAWAEWTIILNLQVKRFFCDNQDCPKRTFAEQFPGFVTRYARRTDRVVARQKQVGVEVCARTAEKLLELDQIGLSDTTVNRMIRALPEPEAIPVRVLGVDDWAKRKGQNYGTILVDLERGQIVDLLADRTAETLAQWLQTHPSPEIISRDRSPTYAEGIDQGAPNAVQVADRWHLLKNLSDGVFKILQQEYATVKMQLPAASQPAEDEAGLPEKILADAAETLTTAEQRRQERIKLAQKLHGRGWTHKNIAGKVDVHPKTVARYLRYAIPQDRRQRIGKRLLDAFKPYLLKRWNEGCHNATQLYREIQQQGYLGKATLVRTFIQQLRQTSSLTSGDGGHNSKRLDGDPTKRPPTLRALTWLIVKRPENRDVGDEQLLKQISEGQAKLATTIELAREFAAIIRGQEAEKLDAWLQKATQCKYRVWNSFAAGLKQDYAAVQAALRLNWSNGPTEGHVNRLKCLKRQMYGRAKDDLLRKRGLWQGRWSFT